MICFLLVALPGFAQNLIKGTVYDSQSEPLPGASVMIQGTKTGTTTDADGNYAIQAKKGDVLVYSFLGMIDNTMTVKDKNVINVRLMPDNYSLDETVVIGYGQAKKSDLTGSVASIKPTELKNSKVGMLSSALQGTAAGVQVTSGNLKPGADAGIVIRGVGSVNAGSSPLCIIDGVPGGLQDVSPSDIASIEILKDASSAAIYGSRGSNGVILITTKKGEGGKTRVSFNAQGGIQSMLNKQDMLNAKQYYDLVMESGQAYVWTSEELRQLSAGKSTDWQDAITQLGTFQNYNMSVSGGTAKMNHYLGVDYYDQKGIIKNSSFDRITLR